METAESQEKNKLLKEFVALGFDVAGLSHVRKRQLCCLLEKLLQRLRMPLPRFIEHTYYSSHEIALVWEYNLHINKHAWHLNDTLMEALFVKNMALVGKLQDTTRTHLYMTGQSKRIFRYGVYFFPYISGNFMHVKNENVEEFFKEIPISKEMSKLSHLNIDVRNHREIMKELFQEKLKAARVMVDGMGSGRDRQKKWGLVPPLYLLWQALEALYISLEFSVNEDAKKNARLIRHYEKIMFQLADMHRALQKIRIV